MRSGSAQSGRFALLSSWVGFNLRIVGVNRLMDTVVRIYGNCLIIIFQWNKMHRRNKLSYKIVICKSWEVGRSQDGRGIGLGDHFLFYKFIERTTERWTKFTKQLLIASSRHQAPRKAAHCLRREVGQKY